MSQTQQASEAPQSTQDTSVLQTPQAQGQAPSITVAKRAGACYGVERALRMVGEAAEQGGVVRTLGPLIHNPRVVADLASRGIGEVGDLDELAPGSTVVIRSHGVVPSVIEEVRAHGLTVLDATCPHVKKAHESASLLASEGYQVVIVGEPGHPEVEGILGHAGEDAIVVDDPAELAGKAIKRQVGVVVQTTQTRELLKAVVDELLPRVGELRVFTTICEATRQRQHAADDLARQADCMVVVGGKNSGNTTRLAEICRASCPATHHIEGADELDPAWFQGVSRIGVTAGASTPADQIESVCAAIEAMTGGSRS